MIEATAFRRIACAVGVLGLLLPALSGAAAQNLEASAVFRVEDVLPPELRRGPHHTVDPTVSVHSFMREYRVRSEFGDFTVVGDARLRILVRELAAIAELRRVKRSDAFLEAAKGAATGPFRAMRRLIDDPSATLSGVPEAATDIFNRVGEQFRRGRRSEFEDSSMKAILAVSSFKRDLARRLGVDVYSTNEALQRELNSVAWASAAGNFSLGAVSMVTGAAVLQVAGYVRLLDQAKSVIESEPPAEISRRSRRQLTAMGLPQPLINRFIEHRSFSPRHQYMIVTALEAMGNVADRRKLLEAVLVVRSEAEAHLFQQTAEMMAAYHHTVQPLARISTEWGFPVGVLAGGQPVVLAPVDHVIWSDVAAGFFTRLPAKAAPARGDRRGARGKAPAKGQVWVTGDFSPRAREEVAARGYEIHPRSGARLPLAD